MFKKMLAVLIILTVVG